MLKTYLIVAIVAYLLGSIPFGYILVKLFLKQDIRQTGSGNIGATNVARSGKKGLAIATLLLDAAKGFAAVLCAGVLPFDEFLRQIDRLAQPYHPLGPTYWQPPTSQLAMAALFAILGHCFPIWLRFRGGKGVATAVGAFAGVSGTAVLACLGVFAVVFAITRFVSLSSMISAAVFPVAVVLLNRNSTTAASFAITAVCSLLIILKHHSNIRRLLNGTEPRFGTPKQAIPADPIEAEKNA
jgi:glycerol-3-phosphate acyltransferase PlsY